MSLHSILQQLSQEIPILGAAENDDENEEIGAEDEENNSYNLGADKKD
jgi:hypothetical protein